MFSRTERALLVSLCCAPAVAAAQPSTESLYRPPSWEFEAGAGAEIRSLGRADGPGEILAAYGSVRRALMHPRVGFRATAIGLRRRIERPGAPGESPIRGTFDVLGIAAEADVRIPLDPGVFIGVTGGWGYTPVARGNGRWGWQSAEERGSFMSLSLSLAVKRIVIRQQMVFLLASGPNVTEYSELNPTLIGIRF